jgi:hypothetical protein
MIVLNLAAFGIGMSKGRLVSAEATTDENAQQRPGISGRSALGVSPLNSTDAKAHVANRPAAEPLF